MIGLLNILLISLMVYNLTVSVSKLLRQIGVITYKLFLLLRVAQIKWPQSGTY